jgi:hypothetical protein
MNEREWVTRHMRDPHAVFVFGSNAAGRHGKGAARDAVTLYGARYGQGFGLQGRSYGIPTKDDQLRVLSLGVIAGFVHTFLLEAAARKDLKFVITRIGCGLAGYNDADIAPLFKGAPDNCYLPESWQEQ